MELAGDEKRIQALFSELSFQDQSCAPPFERVWRKAENAEPRPNRVFTPVIAIATALIIAVACAVGAWSWYRSTQSPAQHVVHTAPPTISTPAAQESITRVTARAENKSNHRPRQKRLAQLRTERTLRQTERALMREAALLASWQSPTERFIESPTTSVWSSLPQLDQSAQELKLFLPKDNELTKESNQ